MRRLQSLAAVTSLVATAIVVTTPLAAAAAAARTPAPAPAAEPPERSAEGAPPVPVDGPPMPQARPPMPAGSDGSMLPEIGTAPDAPPAPPAGSETKKAPSAQQSAQKSAQKAKRGADPAPPSEGTGSAGDPAKQTLPTMPDSTRLEHKFVASVLRARSIEWSSTGNCSDREKTTCTSFTDLRWETLVGLLEFEADSRCRITVTGGTERGHAPGRYSHYNGYKLDIAPSKCVDREIKGYKRQGVRGDGAELYRSPEGGIYARESDHWDITYK